MPKEEKKGNNFLNLFRNFYYFSKLSFKDSPALFITVALLPIALGVIPVISSKYFSKLVDQLVSFISDGLTDKIWIIIFIYIGLRALNPLLWATQTYFERVWQFKFQNILELFISRKKGEIDIAHHENPEFQNRMQRAFNNDKWPIIEVVGSTFTNIINFSQFVAAAIGIIFIDWRLFFLIILTSIPAFWVEIQNGSRIWGIFAENSEEQRKYQHLKSFFSSKFMLIESKIFQLQNNFIKKISLILDDFINKQIKIDKKIYKFRIFAELLSVVGIFVSMVIIINGTISGKFTVGSLVFFFSIVSTFDNALSSFLRRIAKQLERNLFVTDIIDIINTKPTIKVADKPMKVKSTTPEIEFKDVYFKYPGKDRWILEDISFKMRAGEKIGLVGLNGAGKTTLVRLLLRIHDPNKGQILIDGVDLKNLDLNDWWGKVAVLLQDFSSMHFKTKEAISCGRVDTKINTDLVRESAERSTASMFIERWPKKYEEMIGVEFGGEELSKGERQKMALTRVFYRNTNFIILDEPTASIDASSASKIFENIRKLPTDVSALLISHNFATIKLANRIMLIEKGKITEEGTHDELMKLDGTYACLYKQQEKDFTC